MARHLSNKKRKEIKSRNHVFALPHQRKLPECFARILHQLVDAGEGKIEERALLIPEFAIGWPRDSQTAQMMDYLESFAFATSVTPFSALPVH